MGIVSFLLSFSEKWLGPLSKVVPSFVGVLFCVLVVVFFWDRRISIASAFLGLIIGLFLTFHSVTFRFFLSIPPAFCLRLFFAVLAFAALLLIVQGLVKRSLSDNLQKKSFILDDGARCRTIRGTLVGGPLVIFLTICSVFVIGLSHPQPMIGDEVTHFYMMKTQSLNLSQPNFFSEIPLANDEIETRRYPHSFLWHYGGAVLYRISNDSFWVIQCYQAFFLLQLLTVGFLLARSRDGVQSRSALLYTLALASLPLTLIFSVAFYQDVPMTAQVLTAFYLLRKSRWLAATFFLVLAIGLKITAILFLPAFFVLLAIWGTRRSGWRSSLLAVCCSSVIVLSSLWSLGKTINVYAGTAFYPQKQLEILVHKIKGGVEDYLPSLSKGGQSEMEAMADGSNGEKRSRVRSIKSKPLIIANHPGDLRIKVNFLIYGGVLIWLLLFLWVVERFIALRRPARDLSPEGSGTWLAAVSFSYLIFAGYFLKSSPDARFFLPGLVFLLLPISEGVVKIPKAKLVLSLLAALAFFQGGYVLAKVYRLRDVSPGVRAAITYLETHPPSSPWIFMYPEGNYRLFPVSHNWYLQNRLKEFWRADNDKRIKILNQYKIGSIVIKRALIARADKNFTDLGIYPVKFVREIAEDYRFEKVFSNQDILIYNVPPESASTRAR